MTQLSRSVQYSQRSLQAQADALALAIFLSACGGDDAAPESPKSCGDLGTATISAQAIGLPTGGATVTQSIRMPASGAAPSYCMVSGDIRPVDTSAPAIKFSLALPDDWNGKAVMLGGSGFNGSTPSVVTASSVFGNWTFATPLSRGYAVFASDSGHQTQPGQSPTAFAVNDEAYRNYTGDALKKTRDTAWELIKARYAKAPERAYFMGYSKGGGEALIVAQRWPQDWLGVVAGAPAWNLTAVGLQMLWATQALAGPGAWLNQPQRSALFNAVLQACDALDGVNDGLIHNVNACAGRFDPSTATLNGAALRCPGGAATGGNCLSDAQIAALRAVNDRTALAYKLQTGEDHIAGLPIYWADNGGGAGPVSQAEAMASLSVIGSTPPVFPPPATAALSWQMGSEFARNIVVRDPAFNGLLLDVRSGGGYASRLSALSALDGTVADLSPFANRGGRLLLWTGTVDMMIGTRQTEFYYARLLASMGAARVAEFARFYEVPGYGHGYSAIFQPEWDQLTALEQWVEKGADPGDKLSMLDVAGVPGRMRPLCQYPGWARYKGTGDVNRAESFSCTKSE